MVALSHPLVDVLGDLVVEIREGYEAGAWAVDAGLAQHEAFTDTNGPRSSLARAIIKREFMTAAHRLGLSPRSGQGGAAELFELDLGRYAMIRLRCAEVVAGEYRILTNKGSTWGGISDDGFWREEPYVLGWIPNGVGSLDFFVAEVVGKTGESVVYLELGWLHHFTRPDPGDGIGFTPLEDDSLGDWDQPAAEEGGVGGRAVAQ